ncbi:MULTISPECIES: hypothetical protein [unclassified Streptomyces]|uniref:hypothetical protein n=1 Tax=unclassified Streptomyces TaxID=2593676 RepID=UPI00225AB796|nr:hypothetical protein [Streptomyces sp. NBC_01500]MCX4552696.1 hypothetical protein [Streptomyces sp. NBC_01500]WSV57919.1 hypothetical protein OG282_31860 [Streptomyces sp. NBC_01014]
MSTLLPTGPDEFGDGPVDGPAEPDEQARARHLARAASAATRAVAYGGAEVRDATGRTAADIAAEAAVGAAPGRAALLALDTARLALGAAVDNTSPLRDEFAATARDAVDAARAAVDHGADGLCPVANILADGYEARAVAMLGGHAPRIPTREEEAAAGRGEGEPYDAVYVHPEDSAAYTVETRVRQPKNGRSYLPLPFVLSPDARRISPTGELFAPGIGPHWRIAWRPLFS